ncbi:hypothetical protein JCGZ_06905 [Jatropha curcas]|uniref:Arabidopsis retrotransposon Orf1 C-terminal domain-containing protein n=1 Tax=Jatropha curcas TaxID=180498 RepID=A0A067JLG3_JATCU|nr:hypothetical protein JCGZ_06905 [Jatropha curcas]
MAFSPAGLIAVRENRLFEPQNLSIHRFIFFSSNKDRFGFKVQSAISHLHYRGGRTFQLPHEIQFHCKLKIPENANISLKCLTTLEWVDETENAIKFRVKGEELTLDYDKMHRWLGFPKTGFASKPKGWNATSVSEMLICQSAFNVRNASNKWIKDESILYLHKYLCYTLHGRVEATKVQTKDLFLLETVLQGKRVDVTGIMFDTLYSASRHQSKITLGINSMAPILTYAAECLFQLIMNSQPILSDIWMVFS